VHGSSLVVPGAHGVVAEGGLPAHDPSRLSSLSVPDGGANSVSGVAVPPWPAPPSETAARIGHGLRRKAVMLRRSVRTAIVQASWSGFLPLTRIEPSVCRVSVLPPADDISAGSRTVQLGGPSRRRSANSTTAVSLAGWTASNFSYSARERRRSCSASSSWPRSFRLAARLRRAGVS
jgi:hypothetical protein